MDFLFLRYFSQQTCFQISSREISYSWTRNSGQFSFFQFQTWKNLLFLGEIYSDTPHSVFSTYIMPSFRICPARPRPIASKAWDAGCSRSAAKSETRGTREAYSSGIRVGERAADTSRTICRKPAAFAFCEVSSSNSPVNGSMSRQKTGRFRKSAAKGARKF